MSQQMNQLKYFVRQEAGLWDWRVFRRDVQVGHGAADNCIRARAEAIGFAVNRARTIEEQEISFLRLAKATADEAFRDAWNLAVIAAAEIDALRARYAISCAAVARSREAIAQARRLLRATETLRS